MELCGGLNAAADVRGSGELGRCLLLSMRGAALLFEGSKSPTTT